MMMMMTYISFPVMMISLLCKRDRVGIFYLFQSKMTFVQPNFNRPKIPTQFLLDVSPLHLNLWQIWNASKTFARNVDAVLSRLIRIAFQAEGKPDPEILWFKHDAPVTQSSSVKVFLNYAIEPSKDKDKDKDAPVTQSSSVKVFRDSAFQPSKDKDKETTKTNKHKHMTLRYNLKKKKLL